MTEPEPDDFKTTAYDSRRVLSTWQEYGPDDPGLYVLVRVSTTAPEHQRTRIAENVARHVHHCFGDDARYWQIPAPDKLVGVPFRFDGRHDKAVWPEDLKRGHVR